MYTMSTNEIILTFDETLSKSQIHSLLSGEVPKENFPSISFPLSEFAYSLYYPSCLKDEDGETGYVEIHLKSNFVFYVVETDSIKKSLFDTNLRNMFGIPSEKEE